MVRTLAVVLGAVCGLWASTVSALGLGEITLHSALNQSFDAEIHLLQVRDLDTTEIIPRLASPEDFERVGVERFFFLTSLRFQVERRGPEDAIIHITSRQPVTEPYLNFLVEVLWPSGRLLKEYTVLLDPPVMAKDEGVTPVTPAEAMVQPDRSAGVVVRERPQMPQPAQGVERPAPLPAYTKQERFKGDTYGMTDRDDTMWSIALMTRPSRDVSVQQTMLAYVRLNPEAFLGNNVNLVKAGYVLRVPTEEEIRKLSQREAVAAVMRQNELWRAYESGESLQPIDASEPSMSRTVAETGGGELRLVSGAESAQSGGQASTGASDVTRGATTAAPRASDAALSSVQEERDRLARENEDLQQSQQMLASQNENIQRQLQLKDEQLAQLQQQLEQVRKQLELAQQQPSAQQPPVQKQAQPPVQKQPPVKAAPPPPPTAAVAGKGPLALIMDNIVLVGGALAAVLVLFVALRMISARREAAFEDVSFEEALPDEFEAFDSGEQEAAVGMGEASQSFLQEEPEEEVEEFAAADTDFGLDEEDFGLDEEDEAQPEFGGETLQISDVISEADIYIAYGRFPQAISFLQNALDAEPDRTDVRLKLMEVYVETKDLEGFAEQSKALVAQAGNDEAVMRRARQLQARLPGAESIPTTDLEEDLGLEETLVDSDEVADAARAAMADEEAPSLDLDLNLDETDLEDNEDVAATEDEAMDFDLDLETEEEEEEGETRLELDLQDDSERSPTLDDIRVAQEADELDLDLELDLDEDAFTPRASGEHPVVQLSEEGDDQELEGLDLEPLEAEAEPESSEAELLNIREETQEFDLGALEEQLAASEEEAEDQDEEEELGLSDDLELSLDEDEAPEATVTDIASRRASVPEDLPEPATPTSEFDLSELDLDAAGRGGGDFDDDVELLSEGEDETSTKLSLARAYIDMGDTDGARDILNEVVEEGSEEQQKEANQLLAQLG